MDLASDESEVHGSFLCVVGCFLNTWPWSLTLAPTPVRRNTSQNAIWLPVRCSLHEKMVTFRVEMSAGISTAGRDARRSTSFIPAVPAACNGGRCLRVLMDEPDDRLALDPLSRVEGGNGVVEGRDVANVRPQSSVPYPLDELTQLGAIGYDDEVDSQAARGPRLGRAGNGHQRSSGANHARRPLRDVAAEDIENQIDPADIFQGVVIEIDELLCAEVESRLAGGRAPGADDVRACLTCELARHRTDYAGCTVHEDALPRSKAAVLEQPLPRGQVVHQEGGAHREINVARQRCEAACLDGHILRQRAVAIPVREAEHPLSNRHPRRAIAESGDHSGQFVSGD